MEEPSASVGTPTLTQGGSAQVTATFNAAAGGQRIDIDHPAGTKITAVANSAFTLNGQGMTGTLPSGTTSVTFTLTADQNAPIGSALGGQITYGANRTKLADFTATIEAPPVAPAVEIESVTVQQGQSVGVDVEFNESVSGQVDIVLPAGLIPTGNAPAGFTWTPSINGFRGTVTDANRAFTMDLTTAADAAVGTFDGVVRGGGLNQQWSATITAAPVAPAVTIDSVTVQQGESVDVDVEFNESVSGQVDIVLPAGLAPTGKAPSGFTWTPSINGFRGTVTDANRAFTMDLTAANDAAVGTFTGAVRGSGLEQAWSATITAAPVAPDVTIESVTVQQGESVDVDVEFNESVSGEVEIIVPNGLAPVGKAPAGFTWDASGNEFIGTVTNANRAFTMHLAAGANAPVGTFRGEVLSEDLYKRWNVTITAAPVAPDVTIDSVAVQQGDSVDVDVAFNGSVSGEVEIVVPDGLSPDGKAPAGFRWVEADHEFIGTVTDANRAFTMHLAAADDAPVGTFRGYVYGESLYKRWSATITAAPVAPAVTIESVTVQQGESVGVDVAFNASAYGLTDIIVPAGLTPAGKAPAGFTWMPGINGFRGTVTDANRVFTMDLVAATDAAVGTFDGVVRGSQLEQPWSATITAAPVAPAVTIESVTVQQGESVGVDVTFNESVSGQVEILVPAGLTSTGKAPAGFTWLPSINGFSGLVSDANRAFTMDLTAAADAAVGTFDGVVRGGGLNQQWSATITAAPVAPAVTIESVTVQQGESVGVDVTFNESVFGQVDIVLPAGLAPTGKAPTGFTWMPGINGFRGTVTDANRAFTMDLTAAADAAVGTFDGVVRGGGVNEAWSATITAAPVPPAVDIESVTVQQGETVDVDVRFNAMVSDVVDIILPAGLTPAANAPAGFVWNQSINGFRGTVTNANRAFTMDLIAAPDAAVGTFNGVVRGAMLNQVWSATITAAPVAPAVTIESVSVRQGESVDVPVAFNAGVSGQVEIIVPAGLSPAGNAPAGFTWLPSINGFAGTVTDANRAFTLRLTAAADAAVGTFDGVVRGSGLDQAWSATITAGAPIADEPVVLTSPAIGAVLEPGAPVFSGTGQQGAKIEVYGSWQTLLGQTEVLPDGTWSLTWNKALTPGHYSGGTVRQIVGDKPFTSVPYDFTVESTEVAPLIVTSPKVGDTIEETTPVFTGTAQPGAKVEIRGASGSILGSVDSVASSGKWSITWNKTVVPGRYSGGTVKQLVKGVERGKFVYDFTIGNANVAPLLVTSPKVGDTTHETTPVFTGAAQPGAKVEIRGAWGDVLGTVDSVASTGRWTITWNKSLLPGRYSGGTVKQFVNGVERGKFVYDFTIVASQLVVTSPQLGETITGTRPVFTGTAIPNAEIQIRGAWGTDLGHTTANEHGEWTITWPTDYKPARYSGGTVTESVNGKVIGSFTYDFTLAK